MMPKINLPSLWKFILLPCLIFGFFLIHQPAHAITCIVTITKPTPPIPFDFKDLINIQSSSQCFSPTRTYTIIAYPEKLSWEEVLVVRSHVPRPSTLENIPSIYQIKPTDQTTIKDILLDLVSPWGNGGSLFGLQRLLGRDYPGFWNLIVCDIDYYPKPDVPVIGNSFKTDCNPSGGTSVIALGRFEVSTQSVFPTPTAPPDLPVIDKAKTLCIFQGGTDIEMTITNVKPGILHTLWFQGGGQDVFTPTSDPYVLKIGSNNTNFIGDRQLCVDKFTPHGHSIRVTTYNCLTITFSKQNPAGSDRSCNPLTNSANHICTTAVISSCKTGETCFNGQCTKIANGGGDTCHVDTGAIEDFSKIPVEKRGVMTAVGCIPTQPAELIKSILSFVVKIGGGIILIVMFMAVFKIMTSQGDQQALHEGQEQLTSAIAGLLFIIFAVLLLQIIGIDILGIPGFTR